MHLTSDMQMQANMRTLFYGHLAWTGSWPHEIGGGPPNFLNNSLICSDRYTTLPILVKNVCILPLLHILCIIYI